MAIRAEVGLSHVKVNPAYFQRNDGVFPEAEIKRGVRGMAGEAAYRRWVAGVEIRESFACVTLQTGELIVVNVIARSVLRLFPLCPYGLELGIVGVAGGTVSCSRRSGGPGRPPVSVTACQRQSQSGETEEKIT
jgi:hypothetical protein